VENGEVRASGLEEERKKEKWSTRGTKDYALNFWSNWTISSEL
jgi:hypothetical protein